MPKVDIALVAEALKNNNVEPETMHQILHEISEEARKEAEAAADQKEPSVKKQFVIILSDPQGKVPVDDLVGWVAQIPEMDSPSTVTERIIKSAYEFNTSRKGRKNPVKSFGEACEVVGTKFLKEQHVAVKTKLPVTIVRTDNQLPTDEIGKQATRLRREDLR
jgi:hypothetical protein